QPNNYPFRNNRQAQMKKNWQVLTPAPTGSRLAKAARGRANCAKAFGAASSPLTCVTSVVPSSERSGDGAFERSGGRERGSTPLFPKVHGLFWPVALMEFARIGRIRRYSSSTA